MSSRKRNKGFSARALARVLDTLLPGNNKSHFKVAYSGGVDSHVLLHALAGLRQPRSWRLSAIHLDHGLQPESGRWTEHCRQVCEMLDIPLSTTRLSVVDNGEGLEAAARHARYACLAEHIGIGDVLLTAHHRDDQAETVLLQLLRGSGPHGLAAMPAATAFSRGGLVRPLLAFSRLQIEQYAHEQGLTWIEDASNRDRRLARNFLRHEVMPLLRQHWPQTEIVLARSATHMAEAAALLDELAQADLKNCVRADGEMLSVPMAAALPGARLRNLLRYWIRVRGFPLPSTRYLQEIMQQVQQPSRTGQALIRWTGVEVRRYRDSLFVMSPLANVDANLDMPWNPVTPVEIPATGLLLSSHNAIGKGLAQARLKGATLRVRLRRGGEVCQLPGRTHHHKLKKLLQQAGIPPWERRRLPLVYVGSDLAAIGDRWVCVPYAAGPKEPGLELKVIEIGEKTTTNSR